MKLANIAEFKSHLSEYLHCVEAGEQIQICKRNVAVALLTPIKKIGRNVTMLGCGKDSVDVIGDLTEPAFDVKDWNMLKGNM